MANVEIRICGNTAPLSGLSAEVSEILSRLENVFKITCSRPRSYRGRPRVKIAEPWPEHVIQVIVSDEHGERTITVYTRKRPAIARLLRRSLLLENILCE